MTCWVLMKAVEKKNLKDALDTFCYYAFDTFNSYFSKPMYNECLSEYLTVILNSDEDFINQIFEFIKSKNFTFSAKMLATTLSNIYQTKDPFRNAKIIVNYAKEYDICFDPNSMALKLFHVKALENYDFEMISFIHENKMNCLTYCDLIFTNYFNFKMLKFFSEQLKYDFFTDKNSAKQFLNILFNNCKIQYGDYLLDTLKMCKYIFENCGKKKSLLNGLESSVFIKYLRLCKRVEIRAANRIYFWIYPILYRNREFALKQGAKSYDALFAIN